MKMKSYAIKLQVSGYVTVFVDAPDYEEAEDCALDDVYNEDWNEWDLEFEIVESEEEDGGYDG
jgi:hypothetical protein